LKGATHSTAPSLHGASFVRAFRSSATRPTAAPPAPANCPQLIPWKAESPPQLFQCDPLALTPTPGAAARTPPGHPPVLIPNLPKRFGVFASFARLARTLLETVSLIEADRFGTFSQSLARLLKRHRWNDASSFPSLAFRFLARLILLLRSAHRIL
jgi:hypothetical protein